MSKYKIGDRVKIVDCRIAPELNGHEGAISKLANDGVPYSVKIKNRRYWGIEYHWLREDEIELVDSGQVIHDLNLKISELRDCLAAERRDNNQLMVDIGHSMKENRRLNSIIDKLIKD